MSGWIRKRVFICCVALSLLSPATASGAVVVKMATIAPDGTVWHRGLQQMGQEWAEASGGEIKLRIYAGGVAGDEAGIVRKMRIGQLDAATLTGVGLQEIDEAFQVLGMPLFYRSYEELDHVLKALEPVLRQKLEAKGFVFLNWVYAGWAHFFSTEPIRSVDDLKRLKVFAAAGEDRLVQLYKDAGFRPVALSQNDILVGLETGMIEVLPTPPLAALLLQWFRSTPYMLDEGLGPVVGCVVVTKRGWNKIPAARREALIASAERFEARLRLEIPRQDAESIELMKKRGLHVLSLDASKASDWQRVARSFSEKMRGTLVPSGIFDVAATARKNFRNASDP